MELNRLLFALQANVYEFVACNSAEIRRFQPRATMVAQVKFQLLTKSPKIRKIQFCLPPHPEASGIIIIRISGKFTVDLLLPLQMVANLLF